MNSPKQKRQRGVIPTPEGLKKLQAAILELEREEAFESRFTQEKISLYTGLAIRTIRKVFNREGMVSLSTLTSLFSAFNIELQPNDYTKPTLQELEVEEEHPSIVSLPTSRQDWGDAIDVSVFHGRGTELELLQQWINDDRCRLVALLGMGGIGKTALSVKLAQQLQDEFDFLIWRSLRNAPPIETLVSELVQFLSQQQESQGDLRRLMTYLRSNRCLLVLDNAETILQSQQTAGRYQKGYEGYGELFNLIGETAHQSCLILTSREKPKEIAALEGSGLWVRSLALSGCPEAAQALLATQELTGTIAQKQQLAQQYGNSPLAVKIVVTSIKDLFSGDINQFLAQDTPIFNNIRYLISQQFDRLTVLEQSLMYWLAINREWTSIPELAEDIIPPTSRIELLEALESLSWRSLLEKQAGRYTQQPVVMEYVTERLLEQITTELTQIIQNNLISANFLKNHALLKAQASDNIRQIQTRLILNPLIQELLRVFGTKNDLKTQLKELLLFLKPKSLSDSGYLAGNLLNLLCYLQADLSNTDLSGLTIWQADFRNINLQGTNFAHSNLAKSVFTKTFGTAYAIAFSPNNQFIATGHADGEIRLWQLATGQLIFSTKKHLSSVWTLAFSTDGQTLASGSFDQAIKLWDIQTGTEYQTFYGHEDWVREIAFSPDGRFLASCSSDRTLKIWEIKTGKLYQTLYGHTASITTLGFHPQGHLLVSGSEDLSLRLWDLEKGKCLQILQGHTSSVLSVAFSIDGQTLASSEEQMVKLWNVETGECYQTLEDDLTLVWSVAFSPDGQILAGSDGQTLRLWDVETGKCCQILAGYTSQVWALAFNPDGTMLAGSDNESVGIWSVETGERLRTWQGYRDCVGSYWSLVFSPDGQMLVSGSGDGVIRLWDIQTGKCLNHLHQHSGAVRTIAFSPDAKILASGGEDHAIWLWDKNKGTTRQSLLGHTDKVWSVAFSPDGQMLASSSADRTVRLWEVNTGHCLRVLSGHQEQVLFVAFSPDGTLLASGSADRTVKIWSVSGGCLLTLSGHQGWIWCVAFSPDGRFLASGSEDRTIKIWDVQTGECLNTLQGHSKLIWSIMFSKDNQQLISGSADQTAKLWERSTSKCLKTFSGNTDLIWAFHESSQEEILACGNQGENIQLWDFNTEKSLIQLKTPRSYEEMKLSNATGLTEATMNDLQLLGAIL